MTTRVATIVGSTSDVSGVIVKRHEHGSPVLGELPDEAANFSHEPAGSMPCI